MLSKYLKGTYSLLFRFVLCFLCASLLLRFVLLLMSFSKLQLTLPAVLKIFGEGLLFDFGVAVFFCVPYALYLLLFPVKWSNTIINKIITYTAFFIAVLIIMFSFFAEITFWQEFESRFNFIAVDYLIYTFEVINNINESYPLPILISTMLIAVSIIVWAFYKKKIFANTFNGKEAFVKRLVISGTVIGLSFIYAFFIKNSLAENGSNRYQDELSKAGIYSFFAAFKNNELSYDHFYKTIDNRTAFNLARNQFADSNTAFVNDGLSVERKIGNNASPQMPNVIMVTIESFSADFMGQFGNTNKLTPVLDSLAGEGVLFTGMYATGTRTVRGMEALSLAIPPTPGSSIVRRLNNDNLTTIGYIFQQKGYETGFFYGGDGYFDNMNMYFGNNGYAVTDKRRNTLVKDNFKATRTTIPDSFIQFKNAWGICDEDLYDAVIRDADAKTSQQKPFYDFVMTTSNHRPYTYPEGKIDIPSGTGRDGAVKYTDYAIGQFLKKVKQKPWFANTVFIFVADHCANSAGKNEIDIAKYHIPAIIYNLPAQAPSTITAMCSQIDLYPTLFHLLNWNYTSNLYGQNVLSNNYTPRILLGTYQKLGYLKNDTFIILDPQQKVEAYQYNKIKNEQVPLTKSPDNLANEAIANYQTAYYLFKNGGLKQGNK
ncbi:LTA synthase family protein [Flavihumibacter stibioxidans]|uniref:Sulfatase n=1 Tax=Flavihumibacter stibioxidans TaxID=1834163 RepID=A0ABR7M4X4_9BACT|nr:alkaline phosphatase family protein [Flavihumibacter stibioxidans]MBC6489668.1 sulfatase [Flavihumibacter stibioxidans]